MVQFYETKHFIVEAHDRPFVSREDGGHVRIAVKDHSCTDRTKLAPSVAVELMRLTMIVGEALEVALNRRGIPVVKVNYEDLGNWAYKEGKQPFLHVHVFGRARNAMKQPFPEAVSLPDRRTGFYEGFTPLNGEDIAEIRRVIGELVQSERYRERAWQLVTD